MSSEKNSQHFSRGFQPVNPPLSLDTVLHVPACCGSYDDCVALGKVFFDARVLTISRLGRGVAWGLAARLTGVTVMVLSLSYDIQQKMTITVTT